MAGKETALGKRTAAMKAFLGARQGAEEVPVVAPRGTAPVGFMYKVMGKTFAVLAVRGEGYVTLKCDPHLIDILRGTYEGVGKRTHLDPRHWISVTLDGDVPATEIERLALGSYELVCAGLTRKQQAELEAMSR
ncbi:MAG: MmcQ/YjbR family DNA-binding protein [Rhizomicrobium sp.]|jgi:predicted DNA-binding protein (MmcQ/YjbR family)